MALYQHRFLGHTAAGENTMFTWHADSARSSGDAHAAALAWVAALYAGATAGNGLEDHTASTVGLDSVTTVQIDTATGVQITRQDSALSIDGVTASGTLPSDLAVCVSLRTALPRRNGRGRFFLPPVDIDQVETTGRVLADLITDLTSSLTAAWTGYNSASDTPVVYSRKDRVTRAITSFDIGDLFDTQRGREGNLVEARTSASMP